MYPTVAVPPPIPCSFLLSRFTHPPPHGPPCVPKRRCVSLERCSPVRGHLGPCPRLCGASQPTDGSSKLAAPPPPLQRLLFGRAGGSGGASAVPAMPATRHCPLPAGCLGRPPLPPPRCLEGRVGRLLHPPVEQPPSGLGLANYQHAHAPMPGSAPPTLDRMHDGSTRALVHGTVNL